MLPSILTVTSSCTLPCTLPRTLSIASNGILSACLTICFQVSSQDGLKQIPKHTVIYAPIYTQWHTPSLLDYMPPTALSICSQIHTECTLKYTSHYIPNLTARHPDKDTRNVHSIACSQPAGLSIRKSALRTLPSTHCVYSQLHLLVNSHVQSWACS